MVAVGCYALRGHSVCVFGVKCGGLYGSEGAVAHGAEWNSDADKKWRMTMKSLVLSVVLVLMGAVSAFAYTINGKYARLISCDYGYSSVRGESGYTGTYEVQGEIWTVYFGSRYCQY